MTDTYITKLAIPAAYAGHALVVRFADKPNWINWELTKTGKKIPKTLWTPTSKNEMHLRPHLQAINSFDITNGITFHEAYANTKKFASCGIGFIPVGTDVGCLDCDIKHIADPAERETVRVALHQLCEEFDTFTEQSASGGFHAWIELTNKDILERYLKLNQHLEFFSNYNYVAIQPKPDKRNDKPIANRQALLVEKFPQLVIGNGHVGNGQLSLPQPTMSTGGVAGNDNDAWTGPIEPLTPQDEELCKIAAAAKNGDKFKSLYCGEVPQNKHSEADLAFVNIVAFYTDDKEQVVRIFHNSQLGKRVKAYREDYLHHRKYGIITKAFDRELPHINLNNSMPTGGDTDTVEVSFPNPMNDEAFHGLAGDVVNLIFPATEADKHGLLLVFLIVFGFAVGHNAYVMTDGMRQTANNFLAIVGRTSKGRKGTAVRRIMELFKHAFLLLSGNPQFLNKQSRSGLSTGEGLIEIMRDPTEADTKDDYGVTDKRLLIIEGEFARPLKSMIRKENTLSPILRCAWDGDTLQTIARSNKHVCTNPHLSAIVQITLEELAKQLSETEIFSGFGNRFLWLPVKRSKLLSEAVSIDSTAFNNLALRVNQAIVRGVTAGEFKFDDAATAMWKECYEQFPDLPGLVGALTSRAEAHVMRLALVYALLDCSPGVITVEHLKAAMEVWTYCENGVKCLFANVRISLYDRTLEVIRKAAHIGINTTGIHAAFSNKKKGSEINEVLLQLEKDKLIYKTTEQTQGAPVTVYYASGAFSSPNSPNSLNSPFANGKSGSGVVN